MSKIRIMVDTAADMSRELLEENNIGLINFNVNFGDESFVAGVEISNAEFYNKIKETGIMPKTSQTAYADMYDAFKKELEEYDTIIYFTISSKASGQNNTAKLVASEVKEENPGKEIYIVDSGSFSVYIANIAICAAALVKSGASVDEIIEKSLETVNHWGVYLLVDDLDYLQKGGRITKTTAIVGSLLEIKPVLSISEGLIAPCGKLRGKKKVMAKLVEMVEEADGFDSNEPAVMLVHSSEELVSELKEKVSEAFGEDSIKRIVEFGPIIGTHTGPGAVALLYKLK